jgi:putative PIN family toxin of toxin-antitoxin system
MRVLLDTNVLANGITGSLLDNPTPPGRIWRLWKDGRFELLLSRQLREELQRVLVLPWFAAQLSATDRAVATADLSAFSETVEIVVEVSGVASHWQDDLILAAAVSGNADYLVTGDAEFRRVGEYQGVKLRTPAEFLREFDALTG